MSIFDKCPPDAEIVHIRVCMDAPKLHRPARRSATYRQARTLKKTARLLSSQRQIGPMRPFAAVVADIAETPRRRSDSWPIFSGRSRPNDTPRDASPPRRSGRPPARQRRPSPARSRRSLKGRETQEGRTANPARPSVSFRNPGAGSLGSRSFSLSPTPGSPHRPCRTASARSRREPRGPTP